MTVKEWHGPLRVLMEVLMQDAMAGPNAWVARQLPHGALVAMRWERPEGEPIGRYVLRIARKEAPRDDDARARWERELQTFREHFRLTDQAWERADEPGARGVAVRFVERMPLEETPNAEGVSGQP